MIEAINVSKSFEDIKAVDHISAKIMDGNVFGLVGTNGAGKSTFLRMISGVLKPDSGQIKIDGQPVYNNVLAKDMFFYISDEQYFFSNGTPKDMRQFYRKVYKDFDSARFDTLLSQFELSLTRKINTFSKGMKKQLSVICGICSNTKYLLCDETFDGLDPVMRQAVKSIFAKEIAERNMTPIIASHNLRELEDICDHVGLLHRGGMLLSKDLFDMKCGIHKVQCVFQKEEDAKAVLEELDLVNNERRGSLYTLTVRGQDEQIAAKIKQYHPHFMEVLPLSLEEIFISETEVVGYDIKKLIL